MAVSISIAIAQNSQSITNNTSNVTVTVTAKWTSGTYNKVTDASGTPQAKGTVTIDGTSYNFASTFNDNRTTTGSKTICTKTVNVAHGSDGTKTLACSASYNTYTDSSGTVKASASKTLTTIPRKSTLSVSNGTLGTKQTLTVTRQSTSFTHTITATCGTAGTTVCTKTSSTSISFIPPISWASQNTTGTTVTVKYTIKTYNGDTSIGSNTYTKTCSIPASVKPSCTISVSDPTGAASLHGGYVKALSKLKITITPTTAYGSAIKSYSTTVFGATYKTATFTTGVISTYGTLTFKSTVTDARGRSGSATATVEILDYSPPSISSLTVHRCNEAGTANDQGEYVKAMFSARVISINDNNLPTYSIEYKKTTDSTYPDPVVLDCYGAYEVTDYEYIFPADTGSSYDVRLCVDDGIVDPVYATASASTGYTIMHWPADKRGMAIGKVYELKQDDVLDIGLMTQLRGGLLYPTLEPETNLDNVRTPGFYVGENVSTYDYGNCPLTSGTFTLEVLSGGSNGQIWHRLTLCDKKISTTYERFYYGSAWGDWVRTSDFGGKLLWQGVYCMSASQTVTLAEPVSKQNNGIILVFSRYSSGEARDYHFNHAFVHKMFVNLHPGVGNTFLMTTDGSFSVMATKYLYIHDDHIDGNANNEATGTGSSGVTYENNGFVLRYVIGV